MRRHSYHPQTSLGSRRKAAGFASSVTSNFSHSPVCLSRNVGMPLSAETPAPVRTATLVARRSALLSSSYTRLLPMLGQSQHVVPVIFEELALAGGEHPDVER